MKDNYECPECPYKTYVEENLMYMATAPTCPKCGTGLRKIGEHIILGETNNDDED